MKKGNEKRSDSCDNRDYRLSTLNKMKLKMLLFLQLKSEMKHSFFFLGLIQDRSRSRFNKNPEKDEFILLSLGSIKGKQKKGFSPLHLTRMSTDKTLAAQLGREKVST